MLDKCLNELSRTVLTVLDRTGVLQVYLFEWLQENSIRMNNQRRGQELIQEGRRAIQNNQIDRLRAANRELQSLMPSDVPPPDFSGGTVIQR